MKKILVILITLVSFLAYSHAPTLEIEEDEDGYIFVQAGFSNGESAKGLPIIIVQDKNYNGEYETREGKLVLYKGVFNDKSEIVLPKPKAKKYIVIFDGGVGHVIEKKGIAIRQDEVEAWKMAIKKDTMLGEWKDLYTGKVK